MTGPRRSEGRGVSMPRMRPCAVEMTGTVCCAHEEAEKRLMVRQRERRRDTNPNGDKKDGRGAGGEGVLLVLCSDMMMCLGIPEWEGSRNSQREGEDQGYVDPSEVSTTHTQLLLSLAHSTHNKQSRLLQTTFSFCVCVFGPVCESVILCL